MSEGEPPPKLFTPLFWAALAFGLAMTLAGAAVAWLGPRWPARAPPAPHLGAGFDRAQGAWQGAARLAKVRSPEIPLKIQHEVLVGQSRTGDQAGLPQLPSQVL